MAFADVIRSGSAPGTQPLGIGGDINTIWHSNSDPIKLYELSTTDFSVVRFNTPIANHDGAGGKANIIWYVDLGNKRIYEISTVDLSTIRYGSSPTYAPEDVGGDLTTIWHTERGYNRVYELNETDFTIVRYSSGPGTNPRGIGGNVNTIWHCDMTTDQVYELSTSDLSVIRNASTPSSTPMGIGGDSNTIWHVDYGTNLVYELDAPPSTHTLSGIVSDEWGNGIRNADITVSNGTIYTTTTNEDGYYSQIVSPDTYDITVSKSHSRFHDITESSVSISADTTKNIIIPTDKIISKYTTEGMSIIGGISLGTKRN